MAGFTSLILATPDESISLIKGSGAPPIPGVGKSGPVTPTGWPAQHADSIDNHAGLLASAANKRASENGTSENGALTIIANHEAEMAHELLLTPDMTVNATLSRLCAERRRKQQQSRSARSYRSAATRSSHSIKTDPVVNGWRA